MSRHDDQSLLELVERPLDDAAISADLARLEPELRLSVERLRSDRALLMSAPSPVLPMDFVAGMEDLLQPPAPAAHGSSGRAGPGLLRLIGTGLSGRRADHWADRPVLGLAAHPPRRTRWAVATGLGLAACAGAALATSLLITFGLVRTDSIDDHGRTLVAGGDATGGGLAERSAEERSTATLESAVASGTGDLDVSAADLHHVAPPWEREVLAQNQLRAQPGISDGASQHGVGIGSTGGSAAGELGNGAVALVIRTSTPEQGVEALRQALRAASPEEAALVRNVTYREAEELDLAVRMASIPGVQPPPVANAGGSDRRSGPPMAEGQPRFIAKAPVGATLGEHLAGPRSAATPPELQLQLSEDGFSHSITLPVERLRDLLVALAFDESVRIQLGTRGDLIGRDGSAGASGRPSAASDASSAESWRRWQEASAALRAIEGSLEPGSLVTIAVRIDRSR